MHFSSSFSGVGDCNERERGERRRESVCVREIESETEERGESEASRKEEDIYSDRTMLVSDKVILNVVRVDIRSTRFLTF